MGRARRGGGGARRAGRPTPSHPAAYNLAPPDLIPTLRPLTQARAGAAPHAGPGTPLSNSTVSATRARCTRLGKQARLWARGAGRGNEAADAVCGTQGAGHPAGLSALPLSRLAESSLAESPARSRSVPQSSPAPGLLSSPVAGGARGCGLPSGCADWSLSPPTFRREKVVAPSSSSLPEPWGFFLLSASRAVAGRHPYLIPGVPGTPWRGGAGRQVHGWQTPTGLVSTRTSIRSSSSWPNAQFPRGGFQPPSPVPAQAPSAFSMRLGALGRGRGWS